MGATYDASSRDREKAVVAFLDSIKNDAKSIYLLGDILDYWFEYKYVVPKGYVRLFGKIAELADDGVEIIWLTGNHDIWIFDYLPSELGVTVIDASLQTEIDGSVFYLAHGDRCGCDSIYFRLMQKLFRNKICQKLFAAINPRWTIPFALKWSSSSRLKPQLQEDTTQSEKALGRLKNFCENFLTSNPEVNYFIFGHLHIIAREKINKQATMYVIGDWLKHCSYIRFDGKYLSQLTFDYHKAL